MLGGLAANFDWNVAASDALRDRALAIDPLHVGTLVERAFMDAYRHEASDEIRDRALRHFATAVRLDPLNAWAGALHAFGLSSLGRHDAAIAEADRGIRIDPAAFTPRWALLWAHSAAGNYPTALQVSEPALLMSGRGARVLAEIAAVHWHMQNQADAEVLFQEITARAQASYVGFCEQGAIAAAAGHMAMARDLVSRGIAERESYLAFETTPAWEPFKADPVGREMLRHAGP